MKYTKKQRAGIADALRATKPLIGRHEFVYLALIASRHARSDLAKEMVLARRVGQPTVDDWLASKGFRDFIDASYSRRPDALKAIAVAVKAATKAHND